MTRHYSQPLLITLRPSPRLKQLSVIIHALALLATVAADIPIATKFSLLVLVLLSCCHLIKRLNTTYHQLKHSSDFGWQLATVDDDFASVQIMQSTVLTTVACFLHIKHLNGKQKSLLILPDTLANDMYRQVIVRLKTTATALE